MFVTVEKSRAGLPGLRNGFLIPNLTKEETGIAKIE
jgi:hypothetical protein